MAKRNAGSKARATRQTPVAAVESQQGGKTLVQLQAERIAEKYFTDMMAAAGVHVDRMALEVLFWLPRDFMELYQELYMRGLRNTDGGTAAAGEAAAQTGALGKAKATTATNGRRFKKYWVVQDEHALEMKGRIDRRLRAMTRDFRLELEELDFRRERKEKTKRASGGVRPGSGIRAACPQCKVIVSLSWRYCARCGVELEDARSKETRMKLSADSKRNRDV